MDLRIQMMKMLNQNENVRLILKNKFLRVEEILEILLEANLIKVSELDEFQKYNLKKYILKIKNTCGYCKCYDSKKCKHQFHLTFTRTNLYIGIKWHPCKRYGATEQGQKLKETLDHWEWHHRQIGLK